MFCRSLLLILALSWIPLPTIGQRGTDPIWQGVFSAEQAMRGEETYLASCSSCHSADLRGNSNAPSLRGLSFRFLWEGRDLGELFALMQEQMPPDRPGSLSPDAYADILAYILSSNDYPSAATELSARIEDLSNIVITPPP